MPQLTFDYINEITPFPGPTPCKSTCTPPAPPIRKPGGRRPIHNPFPIPPATQTTSPYPSTHTTSLVQTASRATTAPPRTYPGIHGDTTATWSLQNGLCKMAMAGKVGRVHPRGEETLEDVSREDGGGGELGSIQGEATVELSVVVPAYNEEMRLPGMLEETLRYLESRSEEEEGFTWEVIVVDDGSKDGTVGVGMEYVRRYTTERVRVLRMLENVGKGGAVRKGVMVCRGKYVLMADADAATVFEEVERLEGVMSRGGVDVVVGSRRHLRGAERRGLVRGFVSWVFGWVVVWVGGVWGVGDTQCGFKLYSREAARVAFVGQKLRRWAFDVENLYRVQKVGMKVAEVEVRWSEVGGSKLSVVKATINMMWDMVRMRWGYSRGVWKVEVGGKEE